MNSCVDDSHKTRRTLPQMVIIFFEYNSAAPYNCSRIKYKTEISATQITFAGNVRKVNHQ